MKKSIRLMALFLAAWMSIQPLAVCAQELPEEPAEETAAQEQTAETTAPSDEPELPGEPEQLPQETEEAEPTEPDPEQPSEPEQTEEADTPEEPEATEEPEMPEQEEPAQEPEDDEPEQEDLPEEIDQLGEINLDGMSWFDSDQLLWDYIYAHSGFSGAAVKAIEDIESMKDLSDADKELCLALAAGIKRIANGEQQSTTIRFFPSPKALYNTTRVVRALLYLMPYELYWYQKTVGITPKGGEDPETGKIYYDFPMPVVPEYRENANDPFTITSRVKKIQIATRNAANVVRKYAYLDNFGKLDAYRVEICNLTSYNRQAFTQSSSNKTLYGDPWQLIYVFDNDPATNVVCEGYAKAFQYLCDLSVFSPAVQCKTIVGTMRSGSDQGGHMWNIVTIDGANYLVDITNCDSGTSGYPDKLFLCGAEGSPDTQYRVPAANVTYYYKTNDPYPEIGSALELYGVAALTLSSDDYERPVSDPQGTCGTNADWVLCGDCLTITGSGAITNPGGSEWPEWSEYSQQIRSVVISPGITSICADAFADCWNLCEIEIPSSVNSVGAHCVPQDVTVRLPCTTRLNEETFLNMQAAPVIEHSVVYDSFVAETGTRDGKTEGSHCSRCGEVFEPQEIVHKIVIDAGKAATCTTAGMTEGSHCSRCREVLVPREVMPALGHSLEHTEAVEPQEDSAGNIEFWRCSRCGLLFADANTEKKIQNTRCVKVIYLLDGGENAAANPAVYAPGMVGTVTLKNAAKTGYTFGGWYLNGARITQLTEALANKNESLILTAKWTPIAYTVTYNGNGGVTSAKARSYSETVKLYEPPVLSDGSAFTRTGYTLTGWNTRSTGTGLSYAAGPIEKHLSQTNGAAVTLYAVWKPNTYTICFDGADSVPESVPATYNVSVKLPAIPARKFGYRFVGWRDANGKLYKDKVTVKNLTADDGGVVTLTAEWALNTYSVRFNANGGPTLDKVIFAQQSGLSVEGQKALIPDTKLTRIGYTFTGWNTRSDGQGVHYDAGESPEIDAATDRAVITLYAEWQYTVTMDGNGAETPFEAKPQPHFWNESFTAPAPALEKTGYRFVGWNTRQAAANAGSVKYKPGGTVKNPGPDGTVLYAAWKPITYKIRFHANGGTGRMGDKTMTYGKALALPANAFRCAGKVFQGWAWTRGASEPVYLNRALVSNLTSEPNAVITLYAVWK